MKLVLNRCLMSVLFSTHDSTIVLVVLYVFMDKFINEIFEVHIPVDCRRGRLVFDVNIKLLV